ncbi:unnamed protein product [Polarella glacialis]|uniref:Uncharacterized protein n=1 Tax=Polarella glacialis TaxID=89957 RepID=A0A813GA94_POLGL|nr:unnamed protein product [Polarella glacialis]
MAKGRSEYGPLALPKAAVDRPPRRLEDDDCCEIPRSSRLLSMLPVGFVASALMPMAFTEAVLSEQLAGLISPVTNSDVPLSMQDQLLPVLTPTFIFALSPAIGSFIVWHQGSVAAGRPLRCLLTAGLSSAVVGQMLVAYSFDVSAWLTGSSEACLNIVFLGLCLIAFAHASLGLAIRVFCVEAAGSPTRVAEALTLAAFIQIFGTTLGRLATWSPWAKLGYFRGLATEACGVNSLCFDVKVNILSAFVFTLLAGGLAIRATALAAVGKRPRRWRFAKKSASTDQASTSPQSPQPELHEQAELGNVVEAALKDPGMVAVLLTSLLSWIGWWSFQVSVERFLTNETLGSIQGRAVLRAGQLVQLFAAFVAALALPRLMRSLGTFGTWLSGSLLLASLLLLSVTVRSAQSTSFTVAWLSAFGSVLVLQSSLPYVIASRRAKARKSSACLAIALASVPASAAEIFWAWAAADVRALLQSEVAILSTGAVCAVWSAYVSSSAILRDRDGATLQSHRRKP